MTVDKVKSDCKRNCLQDSLFPNRLQVPSGGRRRRARKPSKKGKDTAKLNQAEDELQASKEKYPQLVESANRIIMSRNVKGEIVFFNEFAQKFFGYSEQEIIGKNVIGTIVPKTDSFGRDLVKMIRDIGRHPELYAINENENICKDGHRASFE